MPQILVFVLFFAGVYFLLLRPQQQRVKRQRELITAIGVGDHVVTAGGLIGRVVDLTDDRLELEIADGVVVELLRLAISRRLEESEAGTDFEEEHPVDEPEVSAPDAGTVLPGPTPRPAPPAAASGGTTEEAAGPAPGQEPI